jgi:hypothetical protein
MNLARDRKFFVVITVVIGFIVDVPDPSVTQRLPRKPGTKIVNRPQIIRWFASGFLVAAIALAVLEFGPGKPSTTHASVSHGAPGPAGGALALCAGASRAKSHELTPGRVRNSRCAGRRIKTVSHAQRHRDQASGSSQDGSQEDQE